jgi:NADPH:quinone reductase-like Zn-dependent oxidoreductase
MCCADVWWVWQENLRDLNALFEDKKLRPHIDRVVPLEKVGTHYTVIIHYRQSDMGNDKGWPDGIPFVYGACVR